MSKYYESDAIVLRGVSYGEGNRIFTFYGREEGKFSAVARGILKQKSKLKGHLQLGNRCQLQLVKGRGLDTVASAAATETYAENRQQAALYFYTSYFLELLNDFVPEHMADPALFDLLDGVLRMLSRVKPTTLARFYELRLLSLSGFGPEFGACSCCGTAISSGFLNAHFNGMVCASCGGGREISGKAVFALKYLASTELELISRLKTDEDTDKMMAAATKTLIENSLEKKVKSMSMLKDL